MPLNFNIGNAPLVCLGYQQITVDNVTKQAAVVPPGCILMTFTCENSPARWIASPDVAELTPTSGNYLPMTWSGGFYEYQLNSNSPPNFISQTSTNAVVNVTYYG